MEDYAKVKLEYNDDYLASKDGLTAYERGKGKKCGIPDVTFKKKVWYKGFCDSKDKKNKFENNEMIISTN